MRTIFITFLLTSAFFLHAQKGMHIGGVAAFNSTWIINQNNYGTLEGFSDPQVRNSELAYKITYGYYAGLCLQYYVTDKLGVSTGIVYDKMGQRYEDNMAEGATRINVKRTIDIGYASIPILFEYCSNAKRRVNFYAQVGPQVSIRLYSDEKIWLDGVRKEDTSGITPKLRFSNVDFGVQIGGGIRIKLHDVVYLTTGLHLYYGFLDVNGKAIKDLEWFSKNDISYRRSDNFRGGIQLGLIFCPGCSKFARF